MQITPAVKQLLIINVLFFIGSQILGDIAYLNLSLHYFENSNFKPWQLLTHMFMHAPIYEGDSHNLAHIAFNMFALYSFGSTLEHFWGSKKFVFFYISCGLGAAIIQLGVNYYSIHSILDQLSVLNLSSKDLEVLLNMNFKSLFDENREMLGGQVKTILDNAHCSQEQFNTLTSAISTYQGQMVGASGAIYGLLIAFAFMFPNAEMMMIFLPIPIKAKYFVPILLGLDLFSGITGNSILGSGIAHFAHLGGALIGFLMMWYWKNNRFNHNRWN